MQEQQPRQPVQESSQQPTQVTQQPGGQQYTQQPGGQGFQGAQQGYQQLPSQDFTQMAPQTVQQAVLDLDEFETVAEWAHTKSMEQGNPEVSAITNQLAEIAHLEKKLILGRSPFAETFARSTSQSVQEASQQLQPYSQDPAVQDVLQEAQRVSQTIGQAQQELRQWGQPSMGGGQQYGGGQMGGSMGQQY